MLALLLAGWVAFCALVIANPDVSDPPHSADAIMILGPSLDTRVNTAVQLADSLHISQIAISIGDTSGQAHSGLCAQAPSAITVTCFRPAPYTTEGEARELRTLASKHHWHHVIVIAAKPQISRAHMLMKRCFDGTVQMVADPVKISRRSWMNQFLHQSGAFLKALVRPGC
jgi:uncharacterized SAM-binding protein YcdF (DUF218 family)